MVSAASVWTLWGFPAFPGTDWEYSKGKRVSCPPGGGGTTSLGNHLEQSAQSRTTDLQTGGGGGNEVRTDEASPGK